MKIGIIGGGRFGSYLASDLAKLGVNVLFMDKDPVIVQHMSDLVAKAVQGDAADPQALDEAGFASCETVVTCMASNLEASILATIALKEMKVPQVIAKAGSDNGGKVLERIGADQVVYPERDRATRLARIISARSIVDYMQISPGTGLVEIEATDEFAGKTLSATQIRGTYGLTVLEIRRKNEKGSIRIPAPGGEEIIHEGDTLCCFGTEENLRRFEKSLR
jgi:trk system potassium uptake protein TrkA